MEENLEKNIAAMSTRVQRASIISHQALNLLQHMLQYHTTKLPGTRDYLVNKIMTLSAQISDRSAVVVEQAALAEEFSQILYNAQAAINHAEYVARLVRSCFKAFTRDGSFAKSNIFLESIQKHLAQVVARSMQAADIALHDLVILEKTLLLTQAGVRAESGLAGEFIAVPARKPFWQFW